jgi:dTDP-4-amino-4,6-dideoxygalactose transaminase
MRSHGMTTLTLDRHKGHAFTYDVISLGFNYRINEIHSALGLVQLKKLEKNNQKRREIAKLYFNYLGNLEKIKIPFKNFKHKSNYHIFPILLNENLDRNQIMKKLRNFGIQTSIHYPPIHKFSFYNKNEILTITEKIAQSEITLPMFPTMKEKDIELIGDKLYEFCS